MRACVVCGETFNGSGQRCPKHRRSTGQTRDTRYDDAAYRRVRRAMLEEHVRRFGWWCPGMPELGHGAHASTDLTLDHLLEISRGGSLTSRSNLRVVCRSANDRKRHAK